MTEPSEPTFTLGTDLAIGASLQRNTIEFRNEWQGPIAMITPDGIMHFSVDPTDENAAAFIGCIETFLSTRINGIVVKGAKTPADYPDEQYLVDEKNKPPRFIRGDQVDLSDDRNPSVIPHNTMRFDVHMGSIYGIFDDGVVTKESLAEIISEAIQEAVEATIGEALDGVPIPGGIDRHIFPKSLMLHREMLSCDLS